MKTSHALCLMPPPEQRVENLLEKSVASPRGWHGNDFGGCHADCAKNRKDGQGQCYDDVPGRVQKMPLVPALP